MYKKYEITFRSVRHMHLMMYAHMLSFLVRSYTVLARFRCCCRVQARNEEAVYVVEGVQHVRIQARREAAVYVVGGVYGSLVVSATRRSQQGDKNKISKLFVARACVEERERSRFRIGNFLEIYKKNNPEKWYKNTPHYIDNSPTQ